MHCLNNHLVNLANGAVIGVCHKETGAVGGEALGIVKPRRRTRVID